MIWLPGQEAGLGQWEARGSGLTPTVISFPYLRGWVPYRPEVTTDAPKLAMRLSARRLKSYLRLLPLRDGVALTLPSFRADPTRRPPLPACWRRPGSPDAALRVLIGEKFDVA